MLLAWPCAAMLGCRPDDGLEGNTPTLSTDIPGTYVVCIMRKTTAAVDL